MNIQPNMLQESPLQFIQTSYLQYFFLLMTASHQPKIHLNIDLSTFPTLWAVLIILLDTQDSKCEYVKLLQEEYNTYYADKSRKYMMKLEKKSVEIQNRMHDSVTQNFDSFRSK